MPVPNEDIGCDADAAVTRLKKEAGYDHSVSFMYHVIFLYSLL